MAEVLRRYPGVTAEVVHGKTPPEERKDIIGRFKRGETQMLVGVGVFTEGFDAPNVQVIAMARPTKKQGLYVQMVGRGTRPLPGLIDRYDTDEERQEAISNSLKPACVVLDFVGNSGKHKLVSTADILAGDMPPDLVEAAVEEMKESGEAEDIREAVWRKKEERDEEERKAQEERERKAREAAMREEARRAKLKADAEYRSREINPFGHETAPERHQVAYRGGATDKQVGFLKKLGVKPEVSMAWTVRQAGAVISDLANRRGGDWIMRFGKYAGTPIKSLPQGYLQFMAANCNSEDFQSNLRQYQSTNVSQTSGNEAFF
jgi:superfamily II DNA/RNA helicase